MCVVRKQTSPAIKNKAPRLSNNNSTSPTHEKNKPVSIIFLLSAIAVVLQRSSSISTGTSSDFTIPKNMVLVSAKVVAATAKAINAITIMPAVVFFIDSLLQPLWCYNIRLASKKYF
jgi:hypothetical protein